jgi:hypothetical protein
MKRTSLFSYGYRYDFRSYKPYCAGAVSKLGKLAKGVKTSCAAKKLSSGELTKYSMDQKS